MRYTVKPMYVRPEEAERAPCPIPCTSLHEAESAMNTIMSAAMVNRSTLTMAIVDEQERIIQREQTWFPLRAPLIVQ